MPPKKVIKNKFNTRISYINYIRALKMFYNGYTIGILAEESNDSGEFDWIIRLHWDNWWKSGHVQVAGIDMDLRLKEYIRSYIPAIVEERTYPDTRVNLHKELRKLGLSSNDRYEFICRTKGLCGCNDITMDRLYEGVLTAPIINGDEKAADEVYQDICSLAWGRGYGS